jgi:hypothetical protein
MNIVDWVFGESNEPIKRLVQGEWKTYLMGRQLELFGNELKQLDEFKDKKLIFVDSERVEFPDDTYLYTKSYFFEKNEPIDFEKLFSGNTIYLFGLGLDPGFEGFHGENAIEVKYLIYEEIQKVKIFSSSSINDLNNKVNEFLYKIQDVYRVSDILQSSANYSDCKVETTISIWYDKIR